MLEVGQRLGNFEVLAQLNAGGMATLYLARRVGAAGFARPVGLKVVQPELAKDPHFIRMFIDEAKLSAKIQHPNIVHVEELGEVDGSYFLAMEYVHGVSLAELLKSLHRNKRRLAPAMACWIALQVADALHAAHETRDEKGKALEVVHRDVSPQNILLSATGHVKLIDFGIAKALGRQQKTSVGALKGKLRYMSPEQARGQGVDRRTDIYALGIVLWEMLTMRRLFRAAGEIELIETVRNPQIRNPREHVAEIPETLAEAVMHALTFDKDARPDTAKALRRALQLGTPGIEQADAHQLSELLHVVLDDTLAERAELLPAHTVDLPAQTAIEATVRAAVPGTRPGRRAQRIVETVTLALDDLEEAQIDDDDIEEATVAPRRKRVTSLPPPHPRQASESTASLAPKPLDEVPTRGGLRSKRPPAPESAPPPTAHVAESANFAWPGVLDADSARPPLLDSELSDEAQPTTPAAFPVTSSGSSTLDTTPRPTKRPSRTGWMMALLTLAGIAIGIGAAAWLNRPTEARPLPPERALAAEAQHTVSTLKEAASTVKPPPEPEWLPDSGPWRPRQSFEAKPKEDPPKRERRRRRRRRRQAPSTQPDVTIFEDDPFAR